MKKKKLRLSEQQIPKLHESIFEDVIEVDPGILREVLRRIKAYYLPLKHEMSVHDPAEAELKLDYIRGKRKNRYLRSGIQEANNLLDLIFIINIEDAIYFYSQYLKETK